MTNNKTNERGVTKILQRWMPKTVKELCDRFDDTELSQSRWKSVLRSFGPLLVKFGRELERIGTTWML